MRQIVFIQTYVQASLECDMYINLSPGIVAKHEKSKDYFLKLIANLYGQKQADHIWNKYMTDKLWDIGFQQSLIDEYLFYYDGIIFMYKWMMDIFLEMATTCWCS